MKIENIQADEPLVHLSDLPIGTVFTVPHNRNWDGHVFIRVWNTDRTMVHLVRLDSLASNEKPHPNKFSDSGGACGQTYQLMPGNIKDDRGGRKYLARIFPGAAVHLGDPKK